MRILVTGRRGFVGQHLERRIQARFPGGEILSSPPEIRDADSVDRLIAETRPDCCIHLAAISTIGAARQSPDDAWNVNLRGTLTLARAILRHTPHSPFIFASTAEAYGATFQSGARLDENAPLAPMNTYAATKAAADLALGALAREGLRVVRMRPFNHTGPGQSPNFVVPAFASQIARIAQGIQVPEIKVGNLDAERDFLDVRDVCDAYLDVLERSDDLESGTILNICSGHTRSIRSILDDLLTLSGVRADILTDPERLRPSDIPVARGNAARIETLLGWAPGISWHATLSDLYAECLRQPPEA